jgi:hypothetical protein
MIPQLRNWTVVLAGLALAVSLLPGNAFSGGDEKALLEGVGKVATALEKKDADGAKKTATEIAKKYELDAIMHLFTLRSKGGIGVGSKAGLIEAKEDGLEKKLTKLAEKPLEASQLNAEAPVLAEMGHSLAAMATVAHAKAPPKDDGKKKVKDWLAWSTELRDASLALASAAKEKKASDLHKAAAKADGACTKCHDVFRD